MNPEETLPFWSVLPFVGMLLSIALLPLVKEHWWEKNRFYVAIFWSLAFLVPFAIGFGADLAAEQLLEVVLLDYLPFIVLLLGLFVVSGGINIKGTIAGTTKNNLAILLLGTFLASWIGTTGAAMLLIRPLIRANAWRSKKAHIVIFFIFLVANIGGSLTPLGDPPLFLGYLRGVPFFWTLQNLWPLLLFNTAVLLLVFWVIDSRMVKKEFAAGRSPLDIQGNKEAKEAICIRGAHNFLFLGIIICAVILNGSLPQISGLIDPETGSTFGISIGQHIHLGVEYFVQLILILFAAGLSLATTRKSVRTENDFEWGPITEVAQLFIGIFITMIPAIILLETYGGSLGIDSPAKFFWTTGALSAFLDNSPTYVVFMTVGGSLGATEGLSTLAGTIDPMILLAISAGAVFMGALTYIGNAPNFMVRSIAESNKIKMPSFFGYMGWSLAILVPLFILNTLLFFM